MPVPTIELTGDAIYGIDHEATRANRMMMEVTKTVKLGRKPPKFGRFPLHFSSYFDAADLGIALPDAVDYATKAKASIQRMYLNDQYGDCVIAGKYHAVGVWSGNDGPASVLGTDQEVYSAYQRICGPGDNGCVITEVLDYQQKIGLAFGGVLHKIDGYVDLDWTNQTQVKVALYLFGSLTIGINLPSAWTSAAIWDVTNTGIVGGHDVTCVGYNAQGVQISSWGRIYTITWAAFLSRKWLEESYAMLAPDWYGSDKLAPCGVNSDSLRSDLALIGGGTTPPIDPTPPVPVPPTPVPPIPVPPTPVPPVPVPPAPNPPIVFPNYVGTARGQIPGSLGVMRDVTLQVSLAPSKSSSEFASKIDWLTVTADLMALLSAVFSKNTQAAIVAIAKLVADFGFEF